MALPLGLERTWLYRRFIMGSVVQEVRARYAGSLLGTLWALLQPLSLIGIYSIVFSSIMRPGLEGGDHPLSYTIFLCSGLLLWMFFVELLSNTTNIFVRNGGLLKKVNFPRLTLPIITLLSALLNYAIIMAIFFLLLLVAGAPLSWALLYIPLVVLVTAGFAIGLGLAFATINVYYRDVAQLLAIITQLWFWLTPVVYPMSVVPERFHWLLAWNPIVPLVEAMHVMFLAGTKPDFSAIIAPSVFMLFSLALGVLVYFRLGADMTDEL